MKEPNEIEKIDQEERMIFIILSIILVVAIGIIVSWYFTKEKYDNNIDDKKEPVEIIKEKKTEEETFDKLIPIPIKKKETIAISKPIIEEKIEVISKPIIEIDLSGIIFKNNIFYKLPKVTAKTKEGKEFVVKTIVQYKNSNEEILELDIDDENQILIPEDAIELIFNFKTIDQNGEEIIKVIKTPVTIEDPVNVRYTVTFNNVDDLPDLEIEADKSIEKPDEYKEFETKITLVQKDEDEDEENEDTVTTELTFGGWYEDKDFETEYEFGTPVTEDLNLYAKWGYVVEYIDQTEEGSVTLNKLIVSPEENAIDYEATKDGYNFIGWYEDKDFETEYEFGTPVTMNLTLYAKWIEVHNTDITLEEEGIKSNLIGNNLDIEVDLNAIKIEENPNFLLNYSFVAPDDANHYKTNLKDEESIDIIDKQITDSVVLATYESNELISTKELNINVTEAQ